MDENEYVIFAELDRNKFEDILDRLMTQFQTIKFGRQGDDWIWVLFGEEMIEIDSFHSDHLEVKGRRRQAASAQSILDCLEPKWMLKRFSPFKKDHTR